MFRKTIFNTVFGVFVCFFFKNKKKTINFLSVSHFRIRRTIGKSGLPRYFDKVVVFPIAGGRTFAVLIEITPETGSALRNRLTGKPKFTAVRVLAYYLPVSFGIRLEPIHWCTGAGGGIDNKSECADRIGKTLPERIVQLPSAINLPFPHHQRHSFSSKFYCSIQ